MTSKISLSHIQNNLTLRYDPLKSPAFNYDISKVLQNKNSDHDGKITEKIMKSSLLNNLHEKKKPIVISLSSGIDSTILLALIRKIFPKRKIICITATFDYGFDESIQSKKIAEKFDAEIKIVNIKSIFSSIKELVAMSKQPRWNTYTHFVAKEAKKFSDYIVTGDGADELFAGYVFRYKKFLEITKPKDGWKKKTINYLECHNRDWVPDQPDIFGSKIKFNWNDIYQYFKPYFSKRVNLLEQVFVADFNGKLMRDFIPTSNIICKHYKINRISTFLDSNLMDFAFSLPINQKYNKNENKGKLILRKIAKRNGVLHVDEKRGFSPELLLDWKNTGESICASYLLDKSSNIFKRKLINYDWVKNAFDKINNDGDIRYVNRLTSILALEIWYRLFVEKSN